MDKVRSRARVGTEIAVRPLLSLVFFGTAPSAVPLATHPAPNDQPATVVPAAQSAEPGSMQ